MLPNRDPEGHETTQLLSLIDFSGKSVLEIGCGDGRLTRRYASYAQSVTAVDPDLRGLSSAIANPVACAGGYVHFAQAQAEYLPFAAERFDIAIFAWSL